MQIYRVPSDSSTIDSDEGVSDVESDSDCTPPSLSSPLPLTASEEKKVDACTRIGLVATRKYPSAILTEDDRKEMEEIRKSLGMLPRKSQSVAEGEEQERKEELTSVSKPRELIDGKPYTSERKPASRRGIEYFAEAKRLSQRTSKDSSSDEKLIVKKRLTLPEQVKQPHFEREQPYKRELYSVREQQPHEREMKNEQSHERVVFLVREPHYDREIRCFGEERRVGREELSGSHSRTAGNNSDKESQKRLVERHYFGWRQGRGGLNRSVLKKKIDNDAVKNCCRSRFGYKEARCYTKACGVRTGQRRPPVMGDGRLLVCSLCSQRMSHGERQWVPGIESGWYEQHLSQRPLFGGSHPTFGQTDIFRSHSRLPGSQRVKPANQFQGSYFQQHMKKKKKKTRNIPGQRKTRVPLPPPPPAFSQQWTNYRMSLRFTPHQTPQIRPPMGPLQQGIWYNRKTTNNSNVSYSMLHSRQRLQ